MPALSAKPKITAESPAVAPTETFRATGPDRQGHFAPETVDYTLRNTGETVLDRKDLRRLQDAWKRLRMRLLLPFRFSSFSQSA